MKKNTETNISCLLILTSTCAYQGVGNVSFSENISHLLNRWSLLRKCRYKKKYAWLNYFSMDWKIIRLVMISRNFWLTKLFPLGGRLTENSSISKKQSRPNLCDVNRMRSIITNHINILRRTKVVCCVLRTIASK